MNLRMWGRPYRTTTVIPSIKGSKPQENPRKTSGNMTSYSLSRGEAHQKMQLNEQLLTQRRQNHLNSQFNRRRNTLKQITRENKKIYERINSQKSLYSQDKMNKSTDSLRSLSRCSSRSSKKNSKILPSKRPSRSRPDLTIESQSIKNAKECNLIQFRAIFSRPATNQENCRQLPNKPSRSVSLRQEARRVETGSMLHRIAEEMGEKPKKKEGGRGRRKLLY